MDKKKKDKMNEINDNMNNINDYFGISKADFYAEYKSQKQVPRYAELHLPSGKIVNVDILDVTKYASLYEALEVKFALLNDMYHQVLDAQKSLSLYEIKDPLKLQGKKKEKYDLKGMGVKVDQTKDMVRDIILSEEYFINNIGYAPKKIDIPDVPIVTDPPKDSQFNPHQNFGSAGNSFMNNFNPANIGFGQLMIRVVKPITNPNTDFIASTGVPIPSNSPLQDILDSGMPDAIFEEKSFEGTNQFAIYAGTLFLIDQNAIPLIYKILKGDSSFGLGF